jgi:polyhydroxyalkanoate synthesis repressor PhaR
MMPGTQRPLLAIRKYSNRRLYDTTRSRHITAEDLYRLVREGHDVVVTDSATGADITHQVLAQMIVEREAPKLEAFPAALLHEIIRANQQMWKRFGAELVSGVTNVITQQADAYAKRVAELGRSFDGSALGKLLAAARERAGRAPAPAEPDDGESLRDTVRRLEAKVDRLSAKRKSRRARRK